MASNLKDLIEEWEIRAGDMDGHRVDAINAIEECIEDLNSTMLVMEADEVVRNLSGHGSRTRSYAGDLALRIRRP